MAVKPLESSTTPLSTIISCFSCKRTDLKLSQCAKCHIAQYCGKECQTKDWPEHKKICQAPANQPNIAPSSISIIWTIIQQEASDWQRRKNAGASGSNDGQVFATMPERVFPAIEATFRANVQEKIALDLGCGHGTTTIYLLEKGWKVIAIDFNEKALSLLREKANKANSNWINTQQLVIRKSNIEDYNFTERVHLVMINDVFPYCNPKNIKDLWDKIYATLLDNGHIAGTFFETGGKAHQIWSIYGAWFVKNINCVEKILSESNYRKEMCRYRPKKGGSSVIEFIGLKIPNS